MARISSKSRKAAVARCQICAERAEGWIVTQVHICTRHVRRERGGAVAVKSALGRWSLPLIAAPAAAPVGVSVEE